MTDGAPVSVSRRIQASPEAIFAVLVDPRLHPEIDGSGMVRAAVTPAKISKLGDEFFMSMHNEEMGDYEMLSRVVEFEPDRRIGWEPALSRASRPEDEDAVGDFAHHVWAYDLVQDGAGGTLVTETYDCSPGARMAAEGGP